MANYNLKSSSAAIQRDIVPVLNTSEFPYTIATLGLRILLLAQALQEGYFPPGTPGYQNGSKSYRTKNPSNIFNFTNGKMRFYSTLYDGCNAYFKQMSLIVTNKTNIQSYSKGYKLTLYELLNKWQDAGTSQTKRYCDVVISEFRRNGFAITKDSTLEDIINISEKKKISPYYVALSLATNNGSNQVKQNGGLLTDWLNNFLNSIFKKK